MNVTVLLADDHPFIRKGLRSLLEGTGEMLVVGEAEDGLQLSQLAERLRPDVIVADLMMPRLNGLEAIREVRQRSPQSRTIVLSMQSARPYIVEAFRSGAVGYVLKDSAPHEVLHAIQQALRGERYLSPKLEEATTVDLDESIGQAEDDVYETLTDREREVLQMAAEGRTAAEIARILSISPRTAEIHRGRMMDKLGLRNQTELVRYALTKGILRQEA